MSYNLKITGCMNLTWMLLPIVASNLRMDRDFSTCYSLLLADMFVTMDSDYPHMWHPFIYSTKYFEDKTLSMYLIYSTFS
jgi:hypothetical protein